MPDPLLKRRTANIQRQVQADGRGFDKTDDLGNQLLELVIGTDQVGPPKLVLQVTDQLVRIIAEQDRAHPAGTLRHQNRAQGTLADGKTNVGVLTGCAVIAGFHAQQLIRRLVKSTVGVEAGVIQRVGHRTAIGQALADLAGTMGRGITLGCQPGHGLEHPMEVKTAQARSQRQFTQRGQVFGGFDLAASGGHGQGMSCGDLALVLDRPFARTITRRLGLRGGVEEFDILRFRQARQAAGATVDAGGFHGIDKLPVGARITRDDSGPARV